MNIIPGKGVLGADIIYKDYLGCERPGKIGFIEPYEGPQDDDDKLVVWIYVIDDDPEYNIHEFVFDAGVQGKPDLKTINYAELRLSSEVVLD
jgi:hypothetical protein